MKVLPKAGHAYMHRDMRRLIDAYGMPEFLIGIAEACLNISADSKSLECARAWEIQAEFLFELSGKMNAVRDDLPARRRR